VTPQKGQWPAVTFQTEGTGMTDLITSAVAALQTKVVAFKAGTAKFVLPGHGAIMIGPGGVAAGDGPADVTLIATADVFQGILDGRIKPMTAYLSGKLTIEGSLAMAMQLGAELG
jgi:putative sterol carrier protein